VILFPSERRHRIPLPTPVAMLSGQPVIDFLPTVEAESPDAQTLVASKLRQIDKLEIELPKPVSARKPRNRLTNQLPSTS
jgi:hypothetical protein